MAVGTNLHIVLAKRDRDGARIGDRIYIRGILMRFEWASYTTLRVS